jgi:phosphatidylglycerol:prolipoprotein diacylglycerol transferase
MFLFIKKNYLLKPGLISSLFLIFYSLFRFFVEFFRVPDEQIGFIFLNLTMGQIISLIFLSSGFYLLSIKKNEN